MPSDIEFFEITEAAAIAIHEQLCACCLPWEEAGGPIDWTMPKDEHRDKYRTAALLALDVVGMRSLLTARERHMGVLTMIAEGPHTTRVAELHRIVAQEALTPGDPRET